MEMESVDGFVSGRSVVGLFFRGSGNIRKGDFPLASKEIKVAVAPEAGLTGMAGLKQLFTVTFTRPIFMLVTDPIIGLFSLYTSFNFSMLFSFLAAFLPVFQSTYGFSPGQSGLVFLGITTGCSVGAIIKILIDQHVYQKQLVKQQGCIPTEQRLWGSMLGSILMPASLFWFAWTAQQSVHWMVPIVAAAFFGAASILIFVRTGLQPSLCHNRKIPGTNSRSSLQVSCVLYLTDVYGAAYGASALAANGLLRYAMGGSFPFFIPASTLLLRRALGFFLFFPILRLDQLTWRPVYCNLGCFTGLVPLFGRWLVMRDSSG